MPQDDNSDKKNEKKEFPWGQIAIAFFGALGVIVTAYFGYLQVKVMQEVELAKLQMNRDQIVTVVVENQDTEDTSTNKPDTSNQNTEVKSERGVKIQNRGEILIGVRENSLYPLAIVEGNSYTGFEIDLAQEIVKRLFNDEVSIKWVPVTPNKRFEVLNKGEIDFLIRNTTHTVSREEMVMFTSNYLQDGARLLVRRGEGINGVADLQGKTVSIVSNSVAGDGLYKAVDAARIRIKPLTFNDTSQAFNAFEEGQADAIVFDWTWLLAWSRGSNDYQITGNVLSSEPLAIGTPPNELDFRDEVDNALRSIIADGTWQILYDRWFPEPPPWTIEEMLSEPPPNR